MGAGNGLTNSDNPIVTCGFCKSEPAMYLAPDDPSSGACEDCIAAYARAAGNRSIGGYIASLRRYGVNLECVKTVCDCCKSAAAQWVVTDPTDVTPQGVRYCDYCATATAAGMERI